LRMTIELVQVNDHTLHSLGYSVRMSYRQQSLLDRLALFGRE